MIVEIDALPRLFNDHAEDKFELNHGHYCFLTNVGQYLKTNNSEEVCQ
jgi:hypothetical protein